MHASNGRDVEIPNGGLGPAYASLPDGARRGMVVLHELFGRQPEIDRVVDRFAAAGYAAVAPNLFGDRFRPLCIAEALRAISSGRGSQIDHIRGARDWLCATTGLEAAHVGLIGFCLGGGFALAAGSGWGAVSTNYGEVPSTEVMRGIGPVIGCYGGRDRTFRNMGNVLRERLRPLGREPEVHLYPEAGHSFLTDGHHPIAAALTRPMLRVEYHPEVAERGWREIFAFFDKNL